MAKYRDRIISLEKDIDEIELQEKEEKELRATENQMNKAKNILEQKQGENSAKRTWFQTHKERMAEKGKGITMRIIANLWWLDYVKEMVIGFS